MPGMSGIELAERVLDRQPGMRVVLLSGYTAETLDLERVVERGVRFVPKPLVVPLAALAACVGRRRDAPTVAVAGRRRTPADRAGPASYARRWARYSSTSSRETTPAGPSAADREQRRRAVRQQRERLVHGSRRRRAPAAAGP